MVPWAPGPFGTAECLPRLGPSSGSGQSPGIRFDAHSNDAVLVLIPFHPELCPAWDEVGLGSTTDRGISENTGSSSYPSLGVAPDGTLFIAWQDGPYVFPEAYVRCRNPVPLVRVEVSPPLQ